MVERAVWVYLEYSQLVWEQKQNEKFYDNNLTLNNIKMIQLTRHKVISNGLEALIF